MSIIQFDPPDSIRQGRTESQFRGGNQLITHDFPDTDSRIANRKPGSQFMQGADKPLRYYMQMGPDPKCLPLIDRLQVSCTTRILNYLNS